MEITEPAVASTRATRPGLEAISSQPAAHVQQRCHSIQAESFSSTPKSRKRKKGSAGRVQRLRQLGASGHIQTNSLEFSDYRKLS